MNVLKSGDQYCTTHTEIANKLGMTFRDISSGNRGRAGFKEIKEREERKSLDFTTETDEIYNKAFTEEELELALHRTKDTAPGSDCIQYKMLKRDAYRRRKKIFSKHV